MRMLLPGERAGLRKGRQEGLQEGRQEEAIAWAVRLARKRFPALSTELEGTIRALPLERLEDLSEALLDFGTLTDLEHWLRAAPGK